MIPDAAPPRGARWKPSYPVRATSSQGEKSATFDFPFNDEEVVELVGSGSRLAEKTIEDFGKRLFKAAFSSDVGTLFEMTHQAAIRSAAGMRIKLILEPPELAELPWEILQPPEWAFAPALSERVPMVRQPDLFGEHRGLDVNGPLEVLLVAASPTDQQPLNLKEERDHILRADFPDEPPEFGTRLARSP